MITIAFFLALLAPFAFAPPALADFSWSNSGGPGQGDAYSLVYDGARDVVYAGSEYRGLWRHKNDSWSQLTSSLDYYSIYDLAYDGARNILYVGSGKCGVWRLEDPDTSPAWTKLSGGLTTSYIRSLTYDGALNQLYCGTSGTGVWRCDSPDTSITWTDTGGALSGDSVPSLTCDTVRNKVYAGTYDGVWRCDDPDSSPSWIDTGGGVSGLTIQTLEYDENHNLVYAGADSNGAWRCEDPDTAPSWVDISGGFGSSTFNDLEYDCAGNVLYGAMGSNAFYNSSPENSSVWNWIAGDSITDTVLSLDYDDAGNTLYAGSRSDAVHECTDPVSSPSWSEMGWIYSHNVTDLLYDGANDVVYASTSEHRGAWRCDDPGGSPQWVRIRTWYSDDSLALDSTNNLLYAGSGGSGNGVWRCASPNTAPAWTQVSGIVDGKALLALAYDGEHNVLYAGGKGSFSSGVYRCTNPHAGPNWEDIGGEVSGFDIYSLVYDEENDVLYGATFANGIWRNDNPQASSTWTCIGENVGTIAYALAHDSTDNILYAGTASGAWRCTAPDDSPTWTNMGGCSSTARSLAFNDEDNLLYNGTYCVGVWCCENPDTSPSWNNTGGDISATSVYALEHDSTNNLVYAAPYGGGMWYAADTPPPKISSVTPASAAQDQTLDVEIVGSGTHFEDSVSQADFGEGITVNSTTVAESIHATANITVDQAANPGPRDVNVITGAETPAPLAGGFTVRDARILSVDPDIGGCGQSNVAVQIVGADTNFQPGATATFSGDGINVNETTVTDTTHATANIDIDPGATPGARDVNVISGGETPDPLLGGFTVVDYPAPTIATVEPNSGPSGGVVSITNLSGDGFRDGALVKLTRDGQEEIEAGNVAVASSSKITCQLDLSGAAVGAWNVLVTNDDGKSGSLPGAFSVKTGAPTIEAISPGSAAVGDTVTINGDNFGTDRGASFVRFDDRKASGYSHWSGEKIRCAVPSGISGTVKVKVTTSAGTSNAKIFTVAQQPEPASLRWYLAEGTTDWGFSTYISIANPNDEEVSACITYMTKDGPVDGGNITLPALSQTTVNPVETVGATDFSTRVECLEGETIAVDRTMTWTGDGAASPDSHCSVGVPAPSTTWYLPEGSSDWGFETFLLIQNPGDATATCTVTYMIQGEAPQEHVKSIPPGSRMTFNMADDIGAKDSSIMVNSDLPVIPERAMYRNNRREGHDSIGTTSASKDFYLAEGTTAWGFTTYVLVQNPNPTPADVSVTYMTGGGPVPMETFNMPPKSRQTIWVNEVLPERDFSTHVRGTEPIIAERAMYWGEASPAGEACHDSIGMSEPHTTFFLPDGQTSDGRETYTLVQNPNDTEVTVELTYLTPTGEGNLTRQETVPGNSRMTFDMSAHSGIDGRAAVMVRSLDPQKRIMVERAMYWNSRGAGTDTIGAHSD